MEQARTDLVHGAHKHSRLQWGAGPALVARHASAKLGPTKRRLAAVPQQGFAEVVEDAGGGRFELVGDVLGAGGGGVDDDATVHDEHDTARRGALGRIPIGLGRQREQRNVEHGSLAGGSR